MFVMLELYSTQLSHCMRGTAAVAERVRMFFSIPTNVNVLLGKCVNSCLAGLILEIPTTKFSVAFSFDPSAVSGKNLCNSDRFVLTSDDQ